MARVIINSMVSSSDDEDGDDEAQQGSIFGASLLFAGTAIGAGMLALPAETAPAGFLPSEASLLACWVFTYATSIVTLEACWTVDAQRDRDRSSAGAITLQRAKDEEESGAGFLSIAQTTLGPTGAAVTAILFWFLLTSIIVAYTSEGGELVSQAVAEFSGSSIQLPAAIGSAAFMAFFASLAIFGTERVDLVNRILVAGLITTFLGLLGIGLPQIHTDLLSRVDWGVVYPPVVAVGILSFGAQNVVPTVLEYLGRDSERTRRAVFIGSLIPLVMYSLWEAVFLGMVPYDPDSEGSKMQIVTALDDVGGTIVKDAVEIFSACAIGSSMAGASVSLVDFFQDALASGYSRTGDTHAEDNELATESPPPPLGGRLLAVAVALGPPLGLACAFPGAFLSALENAGLLGGVSLYGVIPALAVIKLRDRSAALDVDKGDEPSTFMPGRLLGGIPALYAILAISIVLILPEIVRFAETLLGSV